MEDEAEASSVQNQEKESSVVPVAPKPQLWSVLVKPQQYASYKDAVAGHGGKGGGRKEQPTMDGMK